MDGVRAAFVGVLVVSAVLGGITVADFGNRLDDIDTTGVIKDRISVELVETSLREGRFRATLRFENPTKVDIELLGAKLRVYNESEGRIASGPGSRVDDGGDTLPAGGSLTATFEIRLSGPESGPLRSAVRSDGRLATSVGMKLDDVQFSIARDGMETAPVHEEGS